MHDEIQKLIRKGVVIETDHSDTEYVSNIFLREKKDGS